MTFAEFREWVAFTGGLLLFGFYGAMLVSWVRESARRRRAGWAGHLSGGARRPTDVPALGLYANVAHEHRERGDEDPPVYSPRRPAADAAPSSSPPDPRGVLTRAVERRVQSFEQLARRVTRRRLERELGSLRAIIVRARREGRLTPAESDELVDAAEARVWAAFNARGPGGKIAHRRDGIQLGDEASEALLKDVFGDESPDARRR